MREQKKQAFLFRAVDVALALMVITSTALRAHAELPQQPNAAPLALRACELSLERAEAALHAMWNNHDLDKYALAVDVLEERYTWLERGVMSTGYAADVLRPRSMEELAQERGSKLESGVVPRKSLDVRASTREQVKVG